MPVVRRRRKQVPGYRLHRPSGQAVVSGTDIYLGPYGKQVSRNECDRVIAEWLANGLWSCIDCKWNSACNLAPAKTAEIIWEQSRDDMNSSRSSVQGSLSGVEQPAETATVGYSSDVRRMPVKDR